MSLRMTTDGLCKVNQLILHNPSVVILGEFTASEKQSSPSNWDQVAANNRESVMAAVENLIGLGHQRIAFIQGTAGTPSSVKRMAGFLDALNLAGLTMDDNLIIFCGYTPLGGRKTIAEMLNSRGT